MININKLLALFIAVIVALSASIINIKPVEAVAQVDLVLVPATQIVKSGDVFDVVIQAQCRSQEVVGLDAYLDFDPAKLAVIDMNPGTAGIQITGGSVLTNTLFNLADNTKGNIDFSAGAPFSASIYPSETFTVATIRFQALTISSPATLVTFSTSTERPIMVVGDTRGTDVTGKFTGGAYSLITSLNPSDPPGNSTGSSGGSTNGGGSASSGTSNNLVIRTSGFAPALPFYVNNIGKSLNTARLITLDGQASLTIAAGTTILNKAGNPLFLFTVQPTVSPPVPPQDCVLITAYTFGPSGAKFLPPAVISLSYDPGFLPNNVAADGLFLAYSDGTTWHKVDSTIDPLVMSVNAKISQLNSYGLFVKINTPDVPSATLAPVPARTSVATPVSAQAASPAPNLVITPHPSPKPAPSVQPATSVKTAPPVQTTPVGSAILADQALGKSKQSSFLIPAVITLAVINIIMLGVIAFIMIRRR